MYPSLFTHFILPSFTTYILSSNYLYRFLSPPYILIFSATCIQSLKSFILPALLHVSFPLYSSYPYFLLLIIFPLVLVLSPSLLLNVSFRHYALNPPNSLYPFFSAPCIFAFLLLISNPYILPSLLVISTILYSLYSSLSTPRIHPSLLFIPFLLLLVFSLFIVISS